jgi:hypothetical protein
MIIFTDTPTNVGQENQNTQYIIACHPYYQPYIDNYLTWTRKWMLRGGDHRGALIKYCHDIQRGLMPPIYNEDMYTHISEWLPDCFRPCNTLIGSFDGCDGTPYDSGGIPFTMDHYLFAKRKYHELLNIMTNHPYPTRSEMYPMYVRNSKEITYTDVYHDHYIVTSTGLIHIQCHPHYSNSYGEPIGEIEINGKYLSKWRFYKL